MALDVQAGFLIRKLGHDGSRVVRPGLPEPHCYLGFHVQELISYAWWLGYAVTPFEANPRSSVGDGAVANIHFPEGNVGRMLAALRQSTGVLTGQSAATGSHHAVAWDGEKIYNPTGKIETLDQFAINTFWRVTPRR